MTINTQHPVHPAADGKGRPATSRERRLPQTAVPVMGPADSPTAVPVMGPADSPAAVPVMDPADRQ